MCICATGGDEKTTYRLQFTHGVGYQLERRQIYLLQRMYNMFHLIQKTKGGEVKVICFNLYIDKGAIIHNSMFTSH